MKVHIFILLSFLALLEDNIVSVALSQTLKHPHFLFAALVQDRAQIGSVFIVAGAAEAYYAQHFSELINLSVFKTYELEWDVRYIGTVSPFACLTEAIASILKWHSKASSVLIVASFPRGVCEYRRLEKDPTASRMEPAPITTKRTLPTLLSLSSCKYFSSVRFSLVVDLAALMLVPLLLLMMMAL